MSQSRNFSDEIDEDIDIMRERNIVVRNTQNGKRFLKEPVSMVTRSVQCDPPWDVTQRILRELSQENGIATNVSSSQNSLLSLSCTCGIGSSVNNPNDEGLSVPKEYDGLNCSAPVHSTTGELLSQSQQKMLNDTPREDTPLKTIDVHDDNDGASAGNNVKSIELTSTEEQFLGTRKNYSENESAHYKQIKYANGEILNNQVSSDEQCEDARETDTHHSVNEAIKTCASRKPYCMLVPYSDSDSE